MSAAHSKFSAWLTTALPELSTEERHIIADAAQDFFNDNRPKLTSRDVRAIRSMSREGVGQATIAAEFGVNPATVSRIVRGIYY